MEKTALLIIDMQNDFVLENAPLRVKEALSIIGNVRKVLDTFRKSGLPVFHVIRSHRKDGSDIELTRKEVFSKTPYAVEGTKGAEIINELKPKENEYIIKKIRMSAFFNTDLDQLLRSLNIKNVIIAGIQTPNCIRATAFDSVAYSYNTYLVEDAVAAQNENVHKANCFDMANIGIKLIKTNNIGDIIK